MNNMREDTSHVDASDDELIVLGVASTDTQGGPMVGEDTGGFVALGISQD